MSFCKFYGKSTHDNVRLVRAFGTLSPSIRNNEKGQIYLENLAV